MPVRHVLHLVQISNLWHVRLLRFQLEGHFPLKRCVGAQQLASKANQLCTITPRQVTMNLYEASNSGSVESARAALARGEEVNMRGEGGETPLMATMG